ncbi:MAG: hypothetical protein DRP87_00150 [Spirochaetes bacterium]|nr:MAG: hypothetical protein DRP87_00150 [Spirochaetota bacterium]
MRAGEIGLLTSAGIARVRVYLKPKVGLLSTGDELVELGNKPRHGQLVNSNIYILTARLQELDCEPVPIGIGRDSHDSIVEMLRTGLKTDLLISTGGVSVGEKDYVHECLQSLGFIKKFCKVAIKPGKPVLFGTVGETPVFGLPGNPVSSAATFELFAKPALRLLAGYPDQSPQMVRAELTGAVTPGRKREAFLWGYLKQIVLDFFFTPASRQGSGQNRSIQGANALLPLPPDEEEWKPGRRVEVMLLYSST